MQTNLKRHYKCTKCLKEEDSWQKLGTCRSCDAPFVSAVIKTLALKRI